MYAHTHTHAHTHARTPACTHTHTHTHVCTHTHYKSTARRLLVCPCAAGYCVHSNEPTATEKKVALAKVSTSSFNVTNLAKAVTVPARILQGK